jgi:alkylation response protein AidB-like acyl-CoA dehydrogenase
VLPDAVYDAMIDARLFRMLAPAAFGGLELHPTEAYAAYEAVARIDSAAGWNLQNSSSMGAFAAWLPEAGAKEVYAAGPDTLFAGGLFPGGPSLRIDGGWRVSARTSIASGCQRAHWFAVPIVEVDAESMKYNPHTQDPPDILAFVPRDEVDLIDTWHTVGMRGTFSADVVVDDVFVPDSRIAFLEPGRQRSTPFRGPLYGTAPWYGTLAQTTVSLGIAVAALEKLVDLATRKTPSYSRVKLHDREMAQHHAARARELVDASRAFLCAAIRDAYDEAERSGRLSEASKIRCQLAACFGAESCAQAVDLVHEAAGLSSIRIGHGIERHHRDVHALARHTSQTYARYEDVGKMLFGLPPTFFVLGL